ncbi:unnamed protein product [Nippostrongylus brasiliensis]|uniref:Pecanex-like protein n=1 Tax=Nippostrongylus brasiliensis TaxID=27835 RepID=A0A0N4XG67_NIPBR|nr:unnamed protein product [Nippostrongylus brasiliensis]
MRTTFRILEGPPADAFLNNRDIIVFEWFSFILLPAMQRLAGRQMATKFIINKILIQALVYATYCSITYRLPMTGLLTANLICGIKATAIITTIYALEFYLNYAAIYSSVAISLLRVAVVLHPSSSKKVYEASVKKYYFFTEKMRLISSISVPRTTLHRPNFGIEVKLLISSLVFLNNYCSRRDPLLVRRSERSLMLMTFSICISLSINLLIQVSSTFKITNILF